MLSSTLLTLDLELLAGSAPLFGQFVLPISRQGLGANKKKTESEREKERKKVWEIKRKYRVLFLSCIHLV